MDIYKSNPDSVVLHSSGVHRLKSGTYITRLPPIDGNRQFARLPMTQALRWAAKQRYTTRVHDFQLVGRLAYRSEVYSLVQEGHVIEPCTLGFGDGIRSYKQVKEHDDTVMVRLEATNWDGLKPVLNAGKHLIEAAPGETQVDPDNCRMCGWYQPGKKSWYQKGFYDNHINEADEYTDYGTTFLVVFDPFLSEPPERVPRPTLREGMSGEHVGALQKRIGVTADQKFGPLTAARLRVVQAANGLVADGIAGPRTWALFGEFGIAARERPADGPAGVCPSAAALAAIRDADVRWPGRKRASDGIMGDASHQARKSDHNTGLAVDITHDAGIGCDGRDIAEAAIRDPRTSYVIWNKKIYNASIADKWRPYTGANPHKVHVHISIKPEMANDGSPWAWAKGWT